MGPRAVEVTDEIHQVGGRGLTAPEDAAVYLVNVGGEAALIDSGSGHATDLLLANVEAAGAACATVRYLLLTHCHFDHTGGAAQLRRHLGCRTVAHELDASYIESGDNEVTAASWYNSRMEPCPVDHRLAAAQDRIMLSGRAIEAIHIPGHSPGSVAYLIESHGQRILFAQDVHGPLDASLRSNEADYQRSLQTLIRLEADVLCEGHYGIFEGKDEAAAFIRRFVR